jgi:GxxExxY protein
MKKRGPQHLNQLTENVIVAAIEMHRLLGPGFQEITYPQALAIELRQRDITFKSELPVALVYKSEPIGEGRVDLLIENALVVELKTADGNPQQFRRQLVAYLKATQLSLGLVLYFNYEVMRDRILRVINSS